MGIMHSDVKSLAIQHCEVTFFGQGEPAGKITNPHLYKVEYLLTIMGKEKCQICGRDTPALRECILCRKRVCPRCFRISMGVCKACVPGQEKKYRDVLREYID
jgi:hypothetical protein